MATKTYWYASGFTKVYNKEVDLDTDAIKVMLCSSAYTPDRAAHDYKNDITNEVTGSGYTAGGATLANVTVGYVAANSWAKARANTTAYVVGEAVRPATGNGFLYQCITAGTTAGSIPTYPTTIGGTVTDGSVVWECVGIGGIVFNCDDPTWDPSTISGVRFAVFYDSTPGTDATRPLLWLMDFETDQSSTSGPFTIQVDPTGITFVLVP